MILITTLLIFILHIPVSSVIQDEEPPIFPEDLPKTDKSHLEDLFSSVENMDPLINFKFGNNPLELLLRGEIDFLVNLGIRLDDLLKSYFKLYLQADTRLDELLRDRIQPLINEVYSSILSSTINLKKEFESISNDYDQSELKLESRKPSSFVSLECIKTIFEFVQKIYEIISDEIETKVKDESLKEKMLWALKTKTSLSAFSTQVMHMKMFYDLATRRSIRMKFIAAGISYLLVFESGLRKTILQNRLEEKNDFFNSFIEKYESSLEELTQIVLFHIKEDELPNKEKDKLHVDLEMMHKDFRQIVKPLITINGATLKEVKI